MKQNILIMIAALLAGGTGLFVQHFNAAPPLAITATSLLNKQLPDLTDKPQLLNQWQGKILILNFWATWCPPCLEEIPEFIALQTEFADKNVQFVGIAVDEKQAVIDYNARAKINYPILIAGDSGINLSKSFGNTIESVPFTVVLNQTGEIIYRHTGEVHRNELLKVIQPLMNSH